MSPPPQPLRTPYTARELCGWVNGTDLSSAQLVVALVVPLRSARLFPVAPVRRAVIAAVVAQCIALGYAVFAYFDGPAELPKQQIVPAEGSLEQSSDSNGQPEAQVQLPDSTPDKLKIL